MTSRFIPTADVGVLESPEDVLTTLGADGKRKWMYPTPSPGRYEVRRRILGWALIALFVSLPIVRINDRPAVLLDVASREFTFFGFTFFPTDTFLLMIFGIAMLVGIVLLTSLWGRVWCGWACPQTVYLEFVYRPIERLIEGKEHVRKRRDAAPWTWGKLWRKTFKMGIYGLISVALAHVFVSYFTGWDRLTHWITGPPTEHWGFFVLMAGTAGLVLFNFGFFREQMCTIACPYARMQSVLVDEDSTIVSYDFNRGEQRGRGKQRDGLGDCVDCFACVRTCPTGIDIRDGLQMECIACTQCIDACDDIMDKVGRPRGLIRHTSENELEGIPTRKARPRTIVYAGLLLALSTVFTVTVAGRHAYDINVGRSTGAPFTELPDGTIANRLRFRVRNQTPEATSFTLSVVEPASAQLRVVGIQPVELQPQQMKRIESWVVAPRSAFGGQAQVEATFKLSFSDGTEEMASFTLLGPSR